MGKGPTVRFDLFHKPLPEIPLPNDVATWPDPTSRTGLRLNASVVAPTEIERDARERFDRLEGWGTFGWLTVAFDKSDPDSDRAAVDLENIVERHQGDDFDFADDAVYLVNLETGVPAPIDLGAGLFEYTIKNKSRYWTNDTRRSEQNLIWDTVDERVDPATGKVDPDRKKYRPEYDTDFDGVLDIPNLLNPADQHDLTGGCPKKQPEGDCSEYLHVSFLAASSW